MIGTTNVISKKGEIEKLILTLKTNQESNNDLSGVAFTLKYGSFSKDYVWSGNAIDIDIPGYMEYTVTFKDVEGYATPEPITEMAVAGSVRTVNAVYNTEVVSVTVNSINGESMVGQIVTINGTEHTWNGTAVTQKVPFGTTYEVSVNDKEDYITPESQSFTASQAKRSVFMQYVDIPVTDLSKVDIYGNPVAQNTANCYVIKEPGKYMFPIAYGAAIKNGAVNAESYTNNGATNSHDFVNYLGNVITSPYVETDTATQASSVQISIADMDNAVTNLEIVEGDGCRYVKFEVPEVPVVGANAVISVKDSSDVIMWNWHLWLWEDDLAVEEITNATNVKYKILPYNLGSKWDDDSKTYIKNWFYQFGRPTPLLCPSLYNSDSDHVSYGALSFTIASIAANLYNGIKNPTTFYKHNSGYNFNWFKSNSGKTYNLWDAGCTITGNSDNNVVKTIYDPCPVGFKMPNGNTFTYFSTSNVVGSFANGWKFKRYSDDTVGVFFPMSGYRHSETGSLYAVGSHGLVWLSSAESQRYAYLLYFDYSNSSNANPQSSFYRAFGYSVRPVQDSALDLPTHKLTISVTGDSSIPSGYEVKVYLNKKIGPNNEYTRLEYIESTGTQYIDTGFKPNQDTRVMMEVQCLIDGGNYFLFGARTNNSNNNSASLTYGFNAYQTKYRTHYYNGWSDFETSVSFTDKFTIDKDRNVTTIGGSNTITRTYTSFQCAYNMYLFAANTAGSAGTFGKAKMYSCQIYDNGVLIRDYIPAMNADGVAGLYDAVNDTFYTSSGTDNFGYELTEPTVLATQTTASATHELTWGTRYRIVASDVNEFITPESLSYVADVENRDVSLVYVAHSGTKNPSNGVWIQDTDGYFHTESEWDGSYTPNGIAVITSPCSIVVALEDAHTSTCMWGGYDYRTSANTYDTESVPPDFMGENNTYINIEELKGYDDGYSVGAPASEYCDAYIFPNGEKGFLGATGEWQIVLLNKTAVASALAKCGGSEMNNSYWTSTQYNSNFSWYVDWKFERFSYLDKSVNDYVRAFCSI